MITHLISIWVTLLLAVAQQGYGQGYGGPPTVDYNAIEAVIASYPGILKNEANLEISHVVELSQITSTTLVISAPNHPLQNHRPNEVNGGHFIQSVWVRRVDTGDLVFFKNISTNEVMISVEFQPQQELLDAALTSNLQLQAFMQCNIHGSWESEPVALVPTSHWDLAASVLDVDCPNNVRQSMRAADASVEFRADPSLVESGSLEVEFILPNGHFMGIGLNNRLSMAGTDAYIVQSSNPPRITGYNLVSTGPSGLLPDTSLVARVNAMRQDQQEVRMTITIDVPEEQRDHYLLYAFGSDPWATLQTPHTERGPILVGNDYLNVNFLYANVGANSTEVCRPVELVQSEALVGETREIRFTHGVLMFIIWSFNITVGVFVARYERHTSWWLHVHKFLQLVCSLMTVPVYVVGFLGAGSTHFGTTHGKMGIAIAAVSSCQVGSGFVMYKTGKMSQRLLHYLIGHPTVPVDVREAIVLDFEEKPHRIMFLLSRFASKRDPDWLTLKRVQKYPSLDLGNLVRSFVDLNKGCSTHNRLLYYYVVPYKNNINPLHKWLGRALLILAYAQIYLGADALDIQSPVVLWTFYAWIGFLVLFGTFKEIQLQIRRRSAYCKVGSSVKCLSKPSSRDKHKPQETQSEAHRYTKGFYKDKKGYEKELFSMQNFVTGQLKVSGRYREQPSIQTISHTKSELVTDNKVSNGLGKKDGNPTAQDQVVVQDVEGQTGNNKGAISTIEDG